jgi:hypothetical protein
MQALRERALLRAHQTGPTAPLQQLRQRRGQLKQFNIGAVLPYPPWDAVLEEIAKCEVVCAKCHRRRTARRLGSVRSVLAAARDYSG